MTKRKLAFSVNAYTDGRWTLLQAIRRIAEAGYDGVTILADKPLLWLPALKRDPKAWARCVDVICETLEDAGVAVANVNGFTAQGFYGSTKGAPGQKFGPMFADADPRMREWKVWYTKLVMDFACDIGAKDVSIGAGYPPSGFPQDVAWRQMRNAIAECVAYADSVGVRLNIEAEPGLMVGNAAAAERILDEIPSSSFGLNFDMGHYYVAGDDVPNAIRKFASRIHGVDVEDIKATDIGRTDPKTGLPMHEHEVPGDGDMPLREIFTAFRDVGYDGWFTVELYNHSHHAVQVTEQSIRRLTPLLSEAGYA